MLVEPFLLILIVAVLVAAIVHTVTDFVAWSVAVHCVKKFHRLPFFS